MEHDTLVLVIMVALNLAGSAALWATIAMRDGRHREDMHSINGQLQDLSIEIRRLKYINRRWPPAQVAKEEARGNPKSGSPSR